MKNIASFNTRDISPEISYEIQTKEERKSERYGLSTCEGKERLRDQTQASSK